MKYLKAYADESGAHVRTCADRGMRLEFRGNEQQLDELIRILEMGASEIHATSIELVRLRDSFAINGTR